MKNSLKIVLFVVLLCGVFGADEDIVKSVSVMEGDSVTLNPDPTQIKGFIKMQWKFGKTLLAQTRGAESSYKDEEIFRDRLQLDQTGSLTIKNMRTKHSGLYQLQIDHSNIAPSYINFSVTVNESPSVDAIIFVTKNVSLNEGDSVTLDVPQLQGNKLIVWRFGDEGKLIAKADIEAKSSLLYDNDERFRDRLELNDQTGSLIITKTRTTDSGLYTVKISSNKQTLYKRFIVTVSAIPDPGVSPGTVAGIVVAVLLVSAAAAAGVMYLCRRRTSNLPSKTWSVLDGQSVTLNPETEIQTGDEIQWLFGAEDTLIAGIRRETREMTTYEGPDKIFMDRLKLDETTGSLTIKFITTKHSGVYTLKIRRRRETLYKKIFISVSERKIEVIEGEDVTLNPDPEINKDGVILWLSVVKKKHTVYKEQHSGIATFNGKTREIFTYDYAAGGKFRDILKLDETTGSLTIKNTRTSHSGVYKLEIRSSSQVSYQTFIVTVNEKVEEKLLKGEDSVALNPDTEIQRGDQMLWMFGAQDNLIAQIRGETVETYDDGVNKRFKGRLKLDEKTGSLTITNIEAEHTGLYKLQTISRSRGILFKKFKVLIQLRYELAGKEGPVHLYTLNHEIQTGDEIQWMFGDENSLIAGIKGGTVETYDGPDGRFRDRLKLNKKTGDLTISNSTTEHTGHYKLKILSSKGKTNRTYIVIISDEAREKSSMKEKNDSTGNRVNESATVEMPLLNGEDVDVVNEEEGTSSL